MPKTTATLFFTILILGSYCSARSSRPEITSTVSPVADHTHRASVRYEDVENGRDRYLLEESAGHHHEVLLDGQMRALLMLRAPVSAMSTTAAGHAHTVSLSVADP